jgi:hypothetical protein
MAVGLLGALAARPASADPVIAFVKIAGQSSAQYEALNPTVLVGVNNAGVVVFGAEVDVGQLPRTGVFTGIGGPLTTIASPTDGVFESATLPAISDSGRVAFRARVGSKTVIVRKDGPAPPVRIVTDGDQAPGLSTDTLSVLTSCSGGCDVADDGTVIFRATLPSGLDGIYLGSGGILTQLSALAPLPSAGSTVSWPAINNAGLGVFFADEFGEKILLSGIPGALSVRADTAGPFEFFGTRFFAATTTFPPSINDHGSVTFAAGLDNGLRGVFQVNSFGHVSTVVDSSGSFSTFEMAANNNFGGVVFIADLDVGGGHGLYRGSDPVLHKIVAVGDQLDGKTVKDIHIGRDALNDADRVAFMVSFADGTHAVMRADPLVELGLINPDSLNKYAQLSTANATGVEMSQLVPTPTELFDLRFDLEFLTRSGEIAVMLGEWLLGTFRSDDSGAIVLEDLDPKALFPPRGGPPQNVLLRFLLSGPPGSTVRIDNISFPGLMNGAFEIGYFDGWTFDTSRGGAAIVAALETTSVPEPGSVSLLGLGAAVFAFRRRLLRHLRPMTFGSTLTVALVSATPALGGPMLVVANSTDLLPGPNPVYAVDPTSGAPTLLLPGERVSGMTPNLAGNGIYFNSGKLVASDLYEFIPGQAAPTLVTSLTFGPNAEPIPFTALALAAGTLYGYYVDFPLDSVPPHEGFYSIDLSTGIATLLWETATGPGMWVEYGSVDADATTGLLYAVKNADSGVFDPDTFVRVDLATQSVITIATLPAGIYEGLAVGGGRAYFVGRDQPIQIYDFATSTFLPPLPSPFQNLQLGGAAAYVPSLDFSPVPEPTTTVLLAISVGLVIGRRARWRR